MGRVKDPPIAQVVKKEFGDRLRRWRLAEEITQREFAERLGISRDRYANYEDGSNEMPYWLLIKLEEITKKDVRFWIVGRTRGEPIGPLPTPGAQG